MIKKLLYFFNKHQKKSLLLLFVFMFISTIFEMLGLGFIFSIVGALSPANAKSNLFINEMSSYFQIEANNILSYLLLAFLFFYIAKIAFLTFYNWYESNFLYSYKESLSSKVFKEYLNQDFSYFYSRNSSEFIRNLITEVDQFVVYLFSILKLTLEIVVIIGIFFLLSYINLYFTVIIFTIFVLFSVLYFSILKGRLHTWGIQRQKNVQKRIQFMQEGFDGIKIIKLLGREKFFFNKFKTHNVNLSKISIITYFFQGVPRLLLEFLEIYFQYLQHEFKDQEQKAQPFATVEKPSVLTLQIGKIGF